MAAVGGRPDLGEPTRILLVRHGVTDFTAQSMLDGRGGPDPSLNADGRRQARAAASGVRAFLGEGDTQARVITSNLQRAIETGGAIARELGLDAQVDGDWDEQSFGDWDGQAMGYLATHHPEELRLFREDQHYSRPGGETHIEMQARVLVAFDRVSAGGGTAVIATHRKPIMTVLAYLLGISHERIWRLATAPASLTAVELWADGGTSVAFVNDTSHLR